jgi:uncharacterized protein (TIGR02453 family)
MPNAFPGFPREAIAFLRQLQKNNKREWFQPRKERFQERCLGPMLELVELLCDDVRKFAADHVVEPKRAVYRIYRDTRFSKDKTPYKTHVAAMFPRQGLGKNSCAGFYFHVSPDGCEIAGGMYMPGPEELAAVRGAIAADPQGWRKLVEDKSLIKAVGPLLGEKLSRPPKGFLADHPAVDFVRMKQWYFDVSLPADAACKPSFRKEIARRFEAMAPVVHWLNGAVLQATRDAAGEPDPIPRRPEPMF